MIGLIVIVHQQQQTRQDTDRQTWNTGDQKICMYFSPSLTFNINNVFLFSSYAIMGKIFPRNICGSQYHRSRFFENQNTSTRPFSTTVIAHASLQHFNASFFVNLTIFYVIKKHQENVELQALYLCMYTMHPTLSGQSCGEVQKLWLPSCKYLSSVYCLVYNYIFNNRLLFLICLFTLLTQF